MKTKVKITPAHDVEGFVVYAVNPQVPSDPGTRWSNMYATREIAEQYRRSEQRGDKTLKYEVRPRTEHRPEFPSRNYIEERWLQGYQCARDGKPNPYAAPPHGEQPGDSHEYVNYWLTAEGMDYYNQGGKLFGEG